VKIKAAIKVGLIAAPIAVICFWVSPLFIRPVGTTTPEAIKLVTEVEGVGEINRDAEAIFNRFGINGSGLFKSLEKSELKDFQTISGLVSKFGDYSDVVIIPEGAMDFNKVPGFPAQIRIRFGSHFHLHFLYILDCRKTVDVTTITNREVHWNQVASNIFIRN
jgi:hypothetical protein